LAEKNKKMKKKIPTWLGALILIIIGAILGVLIWISFPQEEDITIIPAVNNGNNMDQEEGNNLYCQSKKGAKMALSEAKKLSIQNKECGNKFSGKNVCNENTGTWWLDLDIKKEGCSPACVVNVETKEAAINWRCTGLLPKK
jgi:hypothetical protein